MSDLFCGPCGTARSGAVPFCGRCGFRFDATAAEPVAVGADEIGATRNRASLLTAQAPRVAVPVAASAVAQAIPAPAPPPPVAVAARRAHLVLWSGVVLLLVLAYVTDGVYYGPAFQPVVFPRGAGGDPGVNALWHLAGLALLVSVFWLLPRAQPAPTASRMRALAYVVGAVAVFLIISENLSLYRYASGTAFALVAMGWLEARGRRRIWFLGAIPVGLAIIFLSGVAATLSYEPVPFLLCTNALPLGALAGLAWLAATTGTREPQPTATAVPATPGIAAPAGYAGVPPQNTLAVVAFVLSFFFAIPGVVCGHVALSQIKRTGERGRGLAVAALVIGYLGIALVVAYVAVIAALVTS